SRGFHYIIKTSYLSGGNFAPSNILLCAAIFSTAWYMGHRQKVGKFIFPYQGIILKYVHLC
ncbi:hypothetical protein, partial [Mucilaginibacter sp.]|uniref:hypothetical protein n=1 Tax=Mucilaginibacter sp. TaxID=1882438 RepID=UPI0025E7B895